MITLLLLFALQKLNIECYSICPNGQNVYLCGQEGIHVMRNVEHTITIEELELVVSSIIGLFPRLLLRRTARTNMEEQII